MYQLNPQQFNALRDSAAKQIYGVAHQSVLYSEADLLLTGEFISAVNDLKVEAALREYAEPLRLGTDRTIRLARVVLHPVMVDDEVECLPWLLPHTPDSDTSDAEPYSQIVHNFEASVRNTSEQSAVVRKIITGEPSLAIQGLFVTLGRPSLYGNVTQRRLAIVRRPADRVLSPQIEAAINGLGNKLKDASQFPHEPSMETVLLPSRHPFSESR